MKIRHLLVSALALAASGTAWAQQPYGGCWQPAQIRNWSPETDPVAKFNRSRVPLAQRFKEPQLMKANANQYYEGQVCNATILYDMCSLCPSQGANDFIGYQPTYWQYMDKLVYWAGSASEGIIIPPPGPSIDAAHQAGVKALGQLFFPPGNFGGDAGMIQAMTVKENGKYIMAQKMYEIAKYLGFDGWFINEEIGSSVDTWVGWINDFYEAAHADGDYNMEIQWYKAAGTPTVKILTTDKQTSQFLEYGNVGDYRSFAEQLGCTEEETFSKIYAGVQCVASGLTGYNSALNAAFPTDGHVGSIDLFCPEERAWKDNVKNLIRKPTNNGPLAYEATTKTFQNEEKAWVNNAGDPSDISGAATWRGISGAVLERSVITRMPFVSNMCVGVGKHRFVEGEKRGTQDWNHSGVQSILPTWRWWIENRGDAKVEIDWDDAFNHGSSFRITGLSAGNHLMRLYKTMIPVSGGVARVAFKGATPELKLSTASSVNPDVTLTATSTSQKNGWTVAEYDLSSLSGKTLYMVALNISGDFSLGQLALLPAGYAPVPVGIRNLTVTTSMGEKATDARLTWDWDWSDDFDRFDIYVTSASGTRTLVGQTRGEAFYIPSIAREGIENSVNVEVVPVMKDQKPQTGAVAQAQFAQATAPEVRVNLSKSYLKIGEEATITASGTYNPTGWKWILPAGLELVSGALTDQTITVRAAAVGRQSVTVEATNAVGTSSTTCDLLDVLTEEEYAEVANVAAKKKVLSVTNQRQGYNSSYLLDDDIESSWIEYLNPFRTSGNTSTIVIDLGDTYRLYGFKVYDGQEFSTISTPYKNYSSHTIEISRDNETWTKVVDEEGLTATNIKESYIGPRRARYIRFIPSTEYGSDISIWEFQAYGVPDKSLAEVELNAETSDLALQFNEETSIVVNYGYKGTMRDENFAITASAGNKTVTLGDMEDDADNLRVTIPVTASDMVGETEVIVRAVNGDNKAEARIKVTVDSDNLPNVLAGKDATIRRYNTDYSLTAEYDTFTTGALTDGDTSKEALEMIETPSTHKDDVWVIFEAPESWNLSKVKIHIPTENHGVNDNDREGAVNSEISIALGNDPDNLTTVKTFSELDRVSELTYILPEFKNTKYIGIICNLNPFFYPSLAEVEAYEQNPDAIPVSGPLAMTGWQHDILVEALPAAEHADYTLDDQGWALYTAAVKASGSIAGDDRTVITADGTEFRLAPYDGKNALVMKATDAEQVLTLETPALCEEIQILTISANGQANLQVKANYEDGTSSEVATFTPDDWYGSANGAAVHGLSRIIMEQSGSYKADDIDDRESFRLFEHKLVTDGRKNVTSLSFTSAKRGSYPTVLAVSRTGRKSAIEAPAALTEGQRTVEAYYNLQGIRVSNPAAGLYIVRYTDGTTAKVLVK